MDSKIGKILRIFRPFDYLAIGQTALPEIVELFGSILVDSPMCTINFVKRQISNFRAYLSAMNFDDMIPSQIDHRDSQRALSKDYPFRIYVAAVQLSSLSLLEHSLSSEKFTKGLHPQ